MPIGLETERVYQEKTIDLAPDDLLVMYTDGLMDLRQGVDTLGLERVQEILFSVLSSPDSQEQAESMQPQAVVEHLHTKALSYATSPVPDDIAILAIRVAEIGSSYCAGDEDREGIGSLTSEADIWKTRLE
jgi:serine phosphatase RsbU (regulator of sigma subunit)